MSRFTKQRTFGPRISLTDRQIEKVVARVRTAGLTCFVENCPTGSVYVAIDLPQWDKDINDEWYHDLDCGCGNGIAKIRLSGHDEGCRMDSTHNVVGSKSECMTVLNRWIDEIINEHWGQGRKIMAAVPTNQP